MIGASAQNDVMIMWLWCDEVVNEQKSSNICTLYLIYEANSHDKVTMWQCKDYHLFFVKFDQIIKTLNLTKPYPWLNLSNPKVVGGGLKRGDADGRQVGLAKRPAWKVPRVNGNARGRGKNEITRKNEKSPKSNIKNRDKIDKY